MILYQLVIFVYTLNGPAVTVVQTPMAGDVCQAAAERVETVRPARALCIRVR